MSAHGTRARYTQGCRCADCREANRAYNEKRRRALGMKPQPRGPQTPHGTLSRYTHWHCRCTDCRAANTEHMRRYRTRGAEPSVVIEEGAA